MLSGLCVNENSENILGLYSKAKGTVPLCSICPQISAYPISSAFDSFFCFVFFLSPMCVFVICLYQIEQVLVMVISPLPSDELVVHIEMDHVLLNFFFFF